MMYYMSTLLCAQDGEGTTQANSLSSWSLTASESKEKSKINSVVYFCKKHSWISQEGFKSTLAALVYFSFVLFQKEFLPVNERDASPSCACPPYSCLLLRALLWNSRRTDVIQMWLGKTLTCSLEPKAGASSSPLLPLSSLDTPHTCRCTNHGFISVQSLSCVSLRPHEPQDARPPCPSPTPGVHPNPCPLSQWCHPTISSSVIPFSSCPQSFPASGSFQMSQFFASGGQSIGVSTSTSVLRMNTQDWSPLGWTGSPCSPRVSQESSPTPHFKSINSSVLSFLYSPPLTSIHESFFLPLLSLTGTKKMRAHVSTKLSEGPWKAQGQCHSLWPAICKTQQPVKDSWIWSDL